MLLLVGLGNPGSEYAGNRHNAGFMALDAVHTRYEFPAWRVKFRGNTAAGAIAGEKVLLLKPATYMNESGASVAEAVRFYKLAAGELGDKLVVFHDEIDLEPGKVRLKAGGGLAGHNGLKSIAAHLGPDFRRVRIGVGHPGDKDRVSGHVLDNFAKSDSDWLAKLMAALAEAVPYLVAGDGPRYMTEVAKALDDK